MKKLINLIALVMLVSTNVFTPFSYAQVETSEVIPETGAENVVESGETPESGNEIAGESSDTLWEVEWEWSFPLVREVVNETSPAKQDENLEGLNEEVEDSLDDVETPSTDETEEEDAESDEVAQPVEETPENEIQDEEEKIEELEKVEESVVMSIIPDTTVTLLPWQEFNSIIKTLANGWAKVPYTWVDNNIQSFQRVDVEIAWVTTWEISIAWAEYPVHAWFSWWILYYTTQAEIIQLNEDSQNMFQNFWALTELDLSSFDTSNVTNMWLGVGWLFVWCNKLEEINMSWRDFRNVSNNNLMMGITAWWIPSLTKLNMTNTKYTWNASYAFGWLNKLEELNLDWADTKWVTNMNAMFNWDSNLKILNLRGLDTSNVKDMSAMFYNCGNLTWLNLSNFDTSNVTSMWAMFSWCNSLENLNLDNWDFRKSGVGSYLLQNTPNLKILSMSWCKIPQLFTNVMWRSWWYPNNSIEKIDVSNWDLSLTKDINWLFWDMKALREVKWLDTWNTNNINNMMNVFWNCSSLTWLDLSSWYTSNVTNMWGMFYQCSGLNELDLSNFDTSKVTDMSYMFNYTPNLRTIYASEKFVTTALSWDTSSKDMFSWTTSVIWWNWTKFDPNYIDKEYAKIDKVWQTWYFTDKNAINVKFINTLDWTETTSTFAKWQKLTPPFVDKYHVVWWYLDEAMTQKIDLNKWVDSYSEIYVKYERNGSSGWWGGGWSSKDTDKDTHWSAEDSQKDSEENAGEEIPPVSPLTEGGLEQPQWQNDASIIKGGADPEVTNGKAEGFTPEFQQAYKFAHENGITTKDTIQSAQMNGKLTRIAMAKMLSQYAVNVLWKEPDTTQTTKFNDVSDKKDADYDNGVTLAYQLWIMWRNMPNNNFRPDDEVTRAEFATALSRLLYSTSDGEYKSTAKYYINHMNKLKKEWIITNTDPKMKELRGYVMIMLMRSAR